MHFFNTLLSTEVFLVSKNTDMSASYETISKEVGYVGHMPFPTLEEAEKLLNDLSSNPTISEFKQALSLYRFTPEAETSEQTKIIYMLQLGLATSREELFSMEKERSILETAYQYFLNLIP